MNALECIRIGFVIFRTVVVVVIVRSRRVLAVFVLLSRGAFESHYIALPTSPIESSLATFIL